MKNKILPFLLIAVIFPYLPGKLRAEHVFFPAIFIFLFIKAINKNKLISKKLFFLSMLLLLSAIFAVMSSNFAKDTGIATSALSMGVRLILPSIILATMAFYTSSKSNIVTHAAKLIVFISIPISFVAIFSGIFDISIFLQYYINNEDESVWSQAFDLGRYTGIFNQPLEAGIFYTVAMLSLIYLISARWWCTSGRILIFFIILIGGFLSLSKNFIILGMLIVIIYSLFVQIISIRFSIFLLLLMTTSIILWLSLSDDNYANSFNQLFSEGGVVLAVTAGRFGSVETEVTLLWDKLFFSENWIYGFGLGSHLPLDNGYLEYFYQGGILSFMFYIAFLLSILLNISFKNINNESMLLFLLSVFVIFSSLGGPVITANRANVPLLILISTCILSIDRARVK